MLKVLHTDKDILTGEECSECASKEWNWYKLAAIVIATKSTDVVQRALDVVRQQFPTGRYHVKEFARFLRGNRHYSCRYVARNTHDAKVFGVCSDTVSCQGHTH